MIVFHAMHVCWRLFCAWAWGMLSQVIIKAITHYTKCVRISVLWHCWLGNRKGVFFFFRSLS